MESNKNMNSDIDGKRSSKRVWSGRLLGTGLGMAVAWFIIYCRALLVGEELSMGFPYEMWYGLMGAGLSGLGLVLGERFVKNRNGSN